jgi:uridine kinase
MTRSSVLRRLIELVLAVDRPHPIRVAVDGIDAAGKTMLADTLAVLIKCRGRPVIRASVDGFHRPRADRHRRGADSPEGYFHDAFDYPTLRAALLDPLGRGGNRRYRSATFDFRRNAPVRAPLRVAPVDAVLLVDGVFLLRPELADAWDFRIFVEVPFEEALRRACLRDSVLFGSAGAVRERYLRRYFPAQRKYLDTLRPRERAEVVVVNTDPEHPVLLLADLAGGWHGTRPETTEGQGEESGL